MKNVQRSLGRLGALALVALVLPACGSTKSAGQTLFIDSFDSVFPSADWTAATTGSATAAKDTGTGFPLPSLKMTAGAAVGTAKATMTTSFNNPSVTFSVTMADLSAAMTDVGTGTITIFNATPASVAFASWDNTTGKITFHINGAVDVQSIAFPADGSFHRIQFIVSASGSASWSLDNGAALMTQPLAAGMLTLELGAVFGAGSARPSFYFDNVVVSSP